MTIDSHPARSAGPLYERILRSVLARRAGREDPRYIRHDPWSRLAQPDLLARFPVLWMDDSGRVRTDRGYLAVYMPEGLCRGDILFRPGLTEDELRARAFLRLLESRLCVPAGGALLCGVDRDPASLNDGESMRLCRSLRDCLRRHAPPVIWTPGPELPERERGYLGLPMPPLVPPAKAVGFGLCFFAGEALRRVGCGGLDGKALELRGGGPTAFHAAELARRMGARIPDEDGAADVVFLCSADTPLDAEGAEAIIARRPDGVFEGVPLACTPEAVEKLADAGLLFAPASAAGAGASVLTPDDLSSWTWERTLRDAMERILRTVRDEAPADLYRGTCAAALRSAADQLVLRGI